LGEAPAVPVHVATVEAFVVDKSVQILPSSTSNTLVGVEFTVMFTLKIGDVQVGEPGFVTCKVIVFVPVVFQVRVCGPAPVGLPFIQPLQFQL
jgi:hypothetical protein